MKDCHDMFAIFCDACHVQGFEESNFCEKSTTDDGLLGQTVLENLDVLASCMGMTRTEKGEQIKDGWKIPMKSIEEMLSQIHFKQHGEAI